MKFLIATKNAHKLTELSRILTPMGFEVLCERDLSEPLPEVEETGKSFEENALLKAKSAHDATGYAAVADDSGLCIDYLDGAPGIFSARFSGVHGNDTDNNSRVLELMAGVPYEKRTARFVSAIACVFENGESFTVRGECEGHIADCLSGSNGFGYDPLFISEIGCFGEVSSVQKDAVSHRGKSLGKFKEELTKRLGR